MRLSYWMWSEAWKIFVFITALVPSQDWKHSHRHDAHSKMDLKDRKLEKAWTRREKEKAVLEQCNHFSVKHWVCQLIIDHGSLSLFFSCFPGPCGSAKHHARVNQVFVSTWGVHYPSLKDTEQLECNSFSSGLGLYISGPLYNLQVAQQVATVFYCFYVMPWPHIHPIERAASGNGQSWFGSSARAFCSWVVCAPQ